MKSRTTNYEGLPCRALLGIGLSILGLFLAGCSPGQSTAPAQTPSRILAPTATAVPTVAPAPTPTRIAGIDEPIVVKDVSVKDTMTGATYRGDLKLRILNAYTEESRKSGDTTVYPDRPGSVFLTLELELKGLEGPTLSWVGTNARLIYNGETRVGRTQIRLRIKEGKLEGSDSFVEFTVPKDSEFGRYVLKLPDGQTIKLSPFFK